MHHFDPTFALTPDADATRRLAGMYWHAASRLRGRGNLLFPPAAAVFDLRVIARSCRHDGLRRAAGRTLAALVRHDGIDDGPEAA